MRSWSDHDLALERADVRPDVTGEGRPSDVTHFVPPNVVAGEGCSIYSHSNS